MTVICVILVWKSALAFCHLQAVYCCGTSRHWLCTGTGTPQPGALARSLSSSVLEGQRAATPSSQRWSSVWIKAGMESMCRWGTYWCCTVWNELSRTDSAALFQFFEEMTPVCAVHIKMFISDSGRPTQTTRTLFLQATTRRGGLSLNLYCCFHVFLAPLAVGWSACSISVICMCWRAHSVTFRQFNLVSTTAHEKNKIWQIKLGLFLIWNFALRNLSKIWETCVGNLILDRYGTPAK